MPVPPDFLIFVTAVSVVPSGGLVRPHRGAGPRRPVPQIASACGGEAADQRFRHRGARRAGSGGESPGALV